MDRMRRRRLESPDESPETTTKLSSATGSCACGQTWSDPRVEHFCGLIDRSVDVPLASPDAEKTFITQRASVKQPSMRAMASSAPETTTGAASTATAVSSLPPRRAAAVAENIQVFIRIRPLIDRETSQEQRTAATHSIRATDSQTIEVRTSDATIKCSYDAVFDQSFSQEQVYDRVRECTQAFLQGFNSTLFAYGQTGSGKSFTMFGAESDLSRYRPGLQKSSSGVIPRAIKEIFAAVVQMESQARAVVYCSFVQIYNEQIFDLLRDSQMDNPLEIHEDRKNGIYVDGLSEYAVRGVNDCLALLQCGEQHRAVRSTHMNQVSSRSHSVFQLLLEQKRKDGTVVKSKFNMVDLAGSEKWNMGSHMLEHHVSEMTNINLSLHTLGRCIASLSTKSAQHGHVPYRDSKLTRLLQDSLGGNTKTKIIATLSPSMDCVDESISTLKFADRAKQVMVTVRVNEQREIDPMYVEKLEQELQQLREVVRMLRPSAKADGEDADARDHSPADESAVQTRLVKLIQENAELKLRNERQLKEMEQLRLLLSSGGGGSSGNGQDLQVKQQMELTLQQLKDASDRFFRFEIEEEELKKIHTQLFAQSGAASAPPSVDNRKPSRPRPPLLKATGSFSSSPSPIQSSAPSTVDLLYRVRSRSSGAERSKGSGQQQPQQETWKSDAASTPTINPEKELELSRKAIEKQMKLQSWLMQKERRELLKLQQEQQYYEDQRKLAAEKDAKFYRHAAATKKKLLQSGAGSSSNNNDSLD